MQKDSFGRSSGLCPGLSIWQGLYYLDLISDGDDGRSGMTPERAQELLGLGHQTGEYRKHMTDVEIELVYDIWAHMERSSSFGEVLTLIATGQNVRLWEL